MIPFELGRGGPGRAWRVVMVATVAQTLRHVRPLIRRLIASQDSVVLLASPEPLLEEIAASLGARSRGMVFPRRITPIRDLVALFRMQRYLRAYRPDVVHTHSPKASLITLMAARATRVPVRIYHFHGIPWETLGGFKRFLLKSADRLSIMCAGEVWCVSEACGTGS